MVFINVDQPDEISVNTASLDDPAAFVPQKHIFVEGRIAWFDTDDDLPRHQRREAEVK